MDFVGCFRRSVGSMDDTTFGFGCSIRAAADDDDKLHRWV